jgi:hypothetical protein
MEKLNIPTENGDKKIDDDKLVADVKSFFESNNEEKAAIEARAKIFDIKSSDAVYHKTRIKFLSSIIEAGAALSTWRQIKLDVVRGNKYNGGASRSSLGTDAQVGAGNYDLISVTKISDKEEDYAYWKNRDEYFVRYFKDEDPDMVNLIYNYQDIEDKFKNISIGHQSYNPVRPIREGIKRVEEGPVKGIWHGELLAKEKLENEYLRGIGLDDELLKLKLDEYMNLLKQDDFNKAQQEYNERSERYHNYESEKQSIKWAREAAPIISEILREIGIDQVTVLGEKTFEYEIDLIANDKTRIGFKYVRAAAKIIDEDALRADFVDKVCDIASKSGPSIRAILDKRPEHFERSELLDFSDSLKRFESLASDSRKDVKKVEEILECLINLPRVIYASDYRGVWQKPESQKYDLEGELMAIFEKKVSDLAEKIAPVFRYKEPEDLIKLESLVTAIQQIYGNVSVEEIFKKIGRALKVPIYSLKQGNYSLVYPFENQE